ncbi:primosomal protein N' [Patescibacteria group bacterium]
MFSVFTLKSTKKQTILILPQINNIIAFTKYLPLKLRQRTTILHSEMSRISYWQQWNIIRNKKEGIIIGARQAIFAPASNLGFIIIDDEHNISHKQWDQNPRYNTLKIAEQLQKISSAKLMLSSHTPSLTSYYNSKKNNYSIITENQSDELQKEKKIETINMQDEWSKKNYSIFSEEAIEALKNTILKQKRAIIYVNRKGSSSLTVCKDCGYTPQCPNCNIALAVVKSIYKDASKMLICRHCNYQEPIPIPCPKCKGNNIKYIGTGTEKVKKEIHKLFSEINTGIVDLSVKTENIKKTISNFEEGNINILIGTKAILSYNMPEEIDLIIILNIDTDLQIPNFKAIELTLQTINSFKLLLKDKDKIIIQTYSQNCPLLTMLQTYNFKNYFEKELQNRKNFKYPPFSQLIKLIYKNKNKTLVKDESEKMLSFLKKEFLGNKKIGISYPIFMPINYSKHSAEIIIKNSGMSNDLQEWMIKNISNDWIIDVDAEI